MKKNILIIILIIICLYQFYELYKCNNKIKELKLENISIKVSSVECLSLAKKCDILLMDSNKLLHQCEDDSKDIVKNSVDNYCQDNQDYSLTFVCRDRQLVWEWNEVK